MAIPAFDEHSNLSPGIHEATWDEIADRFGGTAERRQLAERLDIAEQAVQRDEAGGYARATLDRLQRVAAALGLEVEGVARFRPGEDTHGRATDAPVGGHPQPRGDHAALMHVPRQGDDANQKIVEQTVKLPSGGTI